ncbi:hypothetical protein IF2G_08032 [Cordyceps javanica]|nr:hypothetical protein IF2G_08032 [Cordyceps javanica]
MQDYSSASYQPHGRGPIELQLNDVVEAPPSQLGVSRIEVCTYEMPIVSVTSRHPASPFVILGYGRGRSRPPPPQLVSSMQLLNITTQRVQLLYIASYTLSREFVRGYGNPDKVTSPQLSVLAKN